MKYGIREICDVVMKAKSAMKIGNKVFYKDEPVIYFDTLKTSSLEGASTTVYAQGGRGNARLVAWEGERTVTFTMEDALISQLGLMILTGAGLIEASDDAPIVIHTTEKTDEVYPVWADGTTASQHDLQHLEAFQIKLSQKPYMGDDDDVRGLHDYVYVMLLKDDEIITEPYIPTEVSEITAEGTGEHLYVLTIKAAETAASHSAPPYGTTYRKNDFSAWSLAGKENIVFVDYYTAKTSGAYEVDITPESFGGNFYLEASTLFRTQDGIDMPAEFVIPNCKVQSNFTFSMASSGDPSTFTFTMDAFPDYTRWNKKKKVLAAIQVVDSSDERSDFIRRATVHDYYQTTYSEGVATVATGAGSVYDTEQKSTIEFDNRA